MSELIVSPLSIATQIKDLLRDRYASGYPILKELLQNADDAQARHVEIDALPGWNDADNPLLRGPGLLAGNDGAFRQEDGRGILSFGESVKVTDPSAIGKFGLGQKAVFHLCDAFIVIAHGFDRTAQFQTVVNPFLKVDVAGNVTASWDSLTEADVERLRNSAPAPLRKRALLLWLPLRREDLRPAPDVGFSTDLRQPEQVITDFARPDDLRLLLTLLRHVQTARMRLVSAGFVCCCMAISFWTVADAASKACRSPRRRTPRRTPPPCAAPGMRNFATPSSCR